MKSKLSHKMHDYSPILANDSQRGLEEDCKTNKVGSRKEKYSLRERQKRRLGLASVVDLPKRSNHKDDIETTAKPQRTQNQTASKSKAPPLSKYRRKTANARERTRMREINSAFENLRHCVPQSIATDETGPTNEKLTKITTLRLAMKYISLLTDVLNNPNFKGELPLDFLYAAEDTMINKQKSTTKYVKGETKTNILTSKSSKSKNKATITTTTTRTTSTKRVGKRKKKELQSPTMANVQSSKKSQSHRAKSNSNTSAATSSASSSSTSTFSFVTYSSDSLSSHSSSFLDSITSPQSYSNSFVPSMSELNCVKLESDGESLHLSDPCNSPLQNSFNSIFDSGDLGKDKTLLGEHNVLSDIDTPLELSLQLLGAAQQSLEFSMEQPPTTCISPLSALDTFNPFSDFLHEYPEQASLDLFLT